MQENIYLNVYDIHPINNYIWNIGLGTYHSAIEIYKKEYTFNKNGIIKIKAKSLSEIPLRQSILIGNTNKLEDEIDTIVNSMNYNFQSSTYHPMKRNSNSFSDDLCQILLDKSIPAYINRFAYFCSCIPCVCIAAGTDIVGSDIAESKNFNYVNKLNSPIRQHISKDSDLSNYEIVDI